MELNFDAVKPFLMGIALIATFCYGLMASLRRVKTLDTNPTFKAWLPILPTLAGTLLGVTLPFLFPPTTTTAARGFIGALSGMFMGVIFATLRRQIRLYVKKFAGADAKELLAPVDESGNTLPADGSIMSPVHAAKTATKPAQAPPAPPTPAPAEQEVPPAQETPQAAPQEPSEEKVETKAAEEPNAKTEEKVEEKPTPTAEKPQDAPKEG